MITVSFDADATTNRLSDRMCVKDGR